MMIEGRRKKPSMSVETESVSDKKISLPPPLFTRPSTIPSPPLLPIQSRGGDEEGPFAEGGGENRQAIYVRNPKGSGGILKNIWRICVRPPHFSSRKGAERERVASVFLILWKGGGFGMTRLGCSSVGRRTVLCKPTSEKSRKRVCRRRRKGPFPSPPFLAATPRKLHFSLSSSSVFL